MIFFWIGLGILMLFVALFLWGALILAGKADEETTRIYNKHLEESDNKTN